jgi:hypothetical protein
MSSNLQADRPMSAGAPWQRIHTALQARMKRNDEPSKEFICLKDIKDVWSDKTQIAAILHRDSWTPSELHRIQADFIKILSILIWISAFDCLNHFRANIFKEFRTTDSNLPLGDEQLSFLNPAQKGLFLEQQFRFIPETIEENRTQRTLVVDPRRRLPFESVEKDVGVGGYGNVYRVRISLGYLRQSSGAIWPEVSRDLRVTSVE